MLRIPSGCPVPVPLTIAVAGVKRRQLDEYEFVQELQLRARLGWLRELLAKTGYSHVCQDEEPLDAEWLDAATARFGYGDAVYYFNSDAKTAGEIRHGWMWSFGAEGEVRWCCRADTMRTLVVALERGPPPNPKRN